MFGYSQGLFEPSFPSALWKRKLSDSSSLLAALRNGSSKKSTKKREESSFPKFPLSSKFKMLIFQSYIPLKLGEKLVLQTGYPQPLEVFAQVFARWDVGICVL